MNGSLFGRHQTPRGGGLGRGNNALGIGDLVKGVDIFEVASLLWVATIEGGGDNLGGCQLLKVEALGSANLQGQRPWEEWLLKANGLGVVG